MPWAAFLSHPMCKSQPHPRSAPAVTGSLAATLATEPSELFPEVALGQQGSAPWQKLHGSTRLVLAATLGKPGASQSCEDDLQDCNREAQGDQGLPFRKSGFSFAEQMGNGAGYSAESWLSLSDQVTSPGWTGGYWDQRRTCLGDGALPRAKTQPGSASGHRKCQPFPPMEAQRASCTRRLRAGEDAVTETMGRKTPSASLQTHF